MKAYISGALMGSKNLKRSKELYEFIGDITTRNGITPYIPHLNTCPLTNTSLTPDDIFKIDMKCLNNSDLVISYLGSPSLGVGAELAITISTQKPIIAIYHEQDNVSRFVLGMLKDFENTTFIKYQSLNDLETKLTSILSKYELMCLETV